MDRRENSMAEIYGITLKNCTFFQGREGDGAQGSIYLEGKKIGWYNDMADGGEPDIEYYSKKAEKEANERIEKYFREYPQDYSAPDLFYSIVLSLMEIERFFKEARKKGKDVVVAQDPTAKIDLAACCGKIFACKGTANIEWLNKKYELDKYPDMKEYHSLEDFKIKCTL